MRARIVRFPGSGGDRLAGRLHLPDGPVRACALFAHCFTCSKDYKSVVWISRALAERGVAVLRFDFTGLGESEGDFADTNFSSNLEDLEAAARYLGQELAPPQLLIGHSLGGAAMLAVASRIPSVAAVATLAAPADVEHLRDTLLLKAPELASSQEAEVDISGRRFRLRRQLIEDLDGHKLESAIRELSVPLLVMHSPDDRTVPIEHARRIFAAARHPKSFVSLDGADHLLASRREDAGFVAELLSAWASRYVKGPADAAHSDGAERLVEPGTVVVRSSPDGFAQTISTEAHELKADEPERVGGTDTGPNPYDLLLASLGACKSMTMRMYADRKGWPLEEVRIRLKHSRIHAADCEECEQQEGRVDRIEVEIELEGELSGPQRSRILEIADRCPVHRTLKSEIDIRSRLRDDEQTGISSAEGFLGTV